MDELSYLDAPIGQRHKSDLGAQAITKYFIERETATAQHPLDGRQSDRNCYVFPYAIDVFLRSQGLGNRSQERDEGCSLLETS